MRQALINSIFELAKIDPRTAYIGSDLSPDIMARMNAEMPGRAWMEGVSEQYCVGMATGLALEGMVPWVHTIATFLTRRAFEQIALAAQQNLPIRLLGNGGGLIYAPLGPTHLAIDDIALMRSIPNMTVICPCDAEEARELAMASKDYPGPIYFRVGWTQQPWRFFDHTAEIGKAMGYESYAEDGEPPPRVLLISTGSITLNAQCAAEMLAGRDGISCAVMHCHTVKPLDLDGILHAAQGCEMIGTVEEHSLIGGLASALTDAMLIDGRTRIEWPNNSCKVIAMGIPDVWPHRYGTRDDLLRYYRLQPDQIAGLVKEELSQPPP